VDQNYLINEDVGAFVDAVVVVVVFVVGGG